MQTEIMVGKDAMYLLANKINQISNNSPRVVIFTGNSFELNPEKGSLIGALNGFDTKFYIGGSNPNIDSISNATEFLRGSRPTVIIAVGGGSIIDLAKAANIFYINPQEVLQTATFQRRGVYFIAVPTTAGSGSEVTPYASIGRKDGLGKFSFTDEKLIPDAAVLCPPLTYCLPQKLTAITGLDTLTQLIESYWSTNATEATRKMSLKGIRLVINNLVLAFDKPNNEEARNNMLLAANISGQCIAHTKTTICHSVSYPLTSRFNISHGHAVFLTLPSFLEFNAFYLDQNGGERLYQTLNAETAEQAADNLRGLGRNLSIEQRLSKLGVSEGDIPLILDNGFRPDRARNNPVTVTREDLNKVLMGIL